MSVASKMLVAGSLLATLLACACSDDGQAAALPDSGPGRLDQAAKPTDTGAKPTDTGAKPADTGAKPADKGAPKTVFGGARKVTLKVPSSYNGGKALPLVILLHGYGASGFWQTTYFGYGALAEKSGFFLASPDGTTDASGKKYWNGTDACCAFGKGPDDSTYLSNLIKEIKAAYKVDPKRVYFIGHSNGGFMSYRMACDHADQVAAVVSLAGATWLTASKCKPKQKVSILQVHGDLDATIKYAGASIAGYGYPGGAQTTKTWAAYNGCKAATSAGTKKLDLEATVNGAETAVVKHQGCPSGIGVELWTIKGGGHVPIFTANFASLTWGFFQAHPKP